MRYITALCCAVALTALMAPAAHADEYNKRTIVTFSGPVQVPGVTLPAGTYTFKLADPEFSRRVIQIWNKDATHLYTTLLTISDQRMEPTDKPVVLFKETAAGEPPAVQAWFYPGERYGEEFVYPKSQAMKIAKANHTPVLTTAENNTKSDDASLKASHVGRVNENGQFTADNNANANVNNPPAPAANAAPAQASAAPAPVATSGSAQSNTSAHQSNTRTELPRTASELPLEALLGAMMLVAALAVRRVRASARA